MHLAVYRWYSVSHCIQVVECISLYTGGIVYHNVYRWYSDTLYTGGIVYHTVYRWYSASRCIQVV